MTVHRAFVTSHLAKLDDRSCRRPVAVVLQAGPDYPMRIGGPTTLEAPPQGKRKNCN